MPSPPSPHIFNYSPQLLDICENLYFRQSMIKDYQTCPQLMLYKWILHLEEEDAFFASVLGTAGHKVIEEFHVSKKFDYTYVQVAALFTEALQAALTVASVLPRISVNFDSISAQAAAVTPEYTQMLCGYQSDTENSSFHSTVNEQTFALELTDEFRRTFIFTGTIDQAGFYSNGSFAVRDIKFRQNTFRPGKVESKLDLQLSLYTFAARHGSPTCEKCRPVYSSEGQLLYTGPCHDCKEKIGTPLWPQLAAEKCEIIWMRDYTKRKRDEYAKMVTSETEKEFNPTTKRLRKRRDINPKWVDGYKAGENCGPGHITTSRSSAFLEVHVADILRVAGMIRDGRFYRKPGEHCNFWCKFSKPCVDAFETEVEEIDVSKFNDKMVTMDPFAED